MIAALFGLSPTALAILAAVCSPRFGLCALHGQLLYFAGLLLYSFLPLSVNALWLIPLLSCLLFLCGTVMGVFMVRRDLNPRNERNRVIFTAVLVLVNFLLLFLLLHSVFDIMCFRLNEALDLPEVGRFTFMLKIGAGVMCVWLLAGIFFGRRRAGLSAWYAWLGLFFSTYVILINSAGNVTWSMPASLQRALQIRSSLEYFTIAEGAEFSAFIYAIPPILAAFCAVLGYGLLNPAPERRLRRK